MASLVVSLLCQTEGARHLQHGSWTEPGFEPESMRSLQVRRGEMLQVHCRDRRGAYVPYQEKDLRCDITQGYLRKEGASQVMKGGVLHRGLVGASKRGGPGLG